MSKHALRDARGRFVPSQRADVEDCPTFTRQWDKRMRSLREAGEGAEYQPLTEDWISRHTSATPRPKREALVHWLDFGLGFLIGVAVTMGAFFYLFES
jgi:hypothetical protein